MNNYFKAKIGQVIKKDVCTENKFFTEVYKRRYNIEIIGIRGNQLHVYVRSYDICPSGIKNGDTDRGFGDFVLDIKYLKTLDKIIKEIIYRVDTKFVVKYQLASAL